MYTTILKGGYTMIPLLLCSLISIAVIIEKGFSLRRGRVLPPLDKTTGGSPGAPPDDDSPLSVVLETARANRHLSWSLNYESIQLTIKQIASFLERGLVLLEIVAVVSPLLGLLGTVLGMVEVFKVISQVGVGQAQAMAMGISQALITTIAGLIVAIPALVAHGIYSRKVDNLLLALEEEADNYLKTIYSSGPEG